MAFRTHRWTCWAAGFLTALGARSANAQVYSQAPAPAGQYAAPQYNNGAPQYPAAQYPAAQYQRQPVVRQQSPQQPAYPQSQGQPAAYPQYQAQPATPGYQDPTAGNPQYQNPNQPGAYGSQPARQQLPPNRAAATTPYAGAAQGQMQAPGAATYPGASNQQPRGGVRPVQFEQPLDAQQSAVPPQQAAPSDQPGFRATEVSTAAIPGNVPANVAGAEGQAAPEHPLLPALRWAKQGLEEFSKVQDYSCTLVKRERIDGTLGEHEYIFVKVRHQPFSVYTYFLGPARVKGQEAIFVDGQNGNSLLAHGNGIKHRLIGTVSLKPTSTLAMSGNRYPITEMGMRRLLERLLEIGGNDVKYGECSVKFIQGAKVQNRTCTCIQVEHPVPRRNFLFHLARIYVDDQMQLPIRYEAYDWPAPGTNQPQLNEEYTFLNVKVNNGFTDADFSTENPSYGFK
jgi:hypothetical protein